LFPNEASNYQLGGQFAAVAGFVLERAREKGLGRDVPADWFSQTPKEIDEDPSFPDFLRSIV